MSECRFCNLEEKERLILDKTNHSIVIFSNPALVKCHLLVVPKRHIGKLSELTPEERKDLFNLTIKWQEKLFEKFWGCDIIQNGRPLQKEDQYKVWHLHIHLRPREFQDELYKKSQIYEKEIFRDLTNEELNQMKDYLLK